jgi:hypothetical protein
MKEAEKSEFGVRTLRLPQAICKFRVSNEVKGSIRSESHFPVPRVFSRKGAKSQRDQLFLCAFASLRENLSNAYD